MCHPSLPWETGHVLSHTMEVLVAHSSVPGTAPQPEGAATSKLTPASAGVEGQLPSSEWWEGWHTKAFASFLVNSEGPFQLPSSSQESAEGFMETASQFGFSLYAVLPPSLPNGSGDQGQSFVTIVQAHLCLRVYSSGSQKVKRGGVR